MTCLVCGGGGQMVRMARGSRSGQIVACPQCAVRAATQAALDTAAGASTITHGTNSGYVLHRRRGQQACPDCLAAHSRYSKLDKYRRANR